MADKDLQKRKEEEEKKRRKALEQEQRERAKKEKEAQKRSLLNLDEGMFLFIIEDHCSDVYENSLS